MRVCARVFFFLCVRVRKKKEDGLCDKIYIFNETERDVGESKVRGDTHTRTHTHVTLQTRVQSHS